ncbi:CDP-diacylglycerol--glycerol-3-phosphate 3-phosphatidyltransferase [Cellulomonas wangsupingiae]|uniref:CDP-diacylglycerol--glycerol-3-phosphate 3-phosphatidyltransferase n=1 Tax=Cellulomonas wangsupingiae TaxID=2968085 RepID=A0ABY5K9V9_9CELL|nr:CDP-diacylglycerol--glycerol-3-phosphate 3-phosphatidyltransferase [Cellulomonas wangsupingiae]MCC2335252.1 CDP-diacylglycerol--glycerol-3-phosphate 3-phosphatidyltransferase [Cellulomonas wangsupingiae]MCM0639128.1 CDP-diacylglycerol--glycerol-3-phosphate 3-phosphatidyltransferase [Cellulomonas wangsupingiae]UUI66609.1 CDP-diacylglycerol--glycerol-3-phosphate 3-phosphatidyltransferase [Cellulomonas wangsupingiae]
MVHDAPSVWNPANVVTMLRIAVVPVFAMALLADGGHTVGGRVLATGLFVLAAASDRLDGWLARRSGQVTDLGKMLDPIADKLLVGSALVLLSWLGDLWWAVTVLVLLREVGITVMRFFLLRYVVLPASRGGKLKTVLQAVAISLYLLPLDHLPAFVGWLAAAAMGVAVLVTVLTGLDYVRDAVRIRRAAGVPPAAGL